VRKGARTGIVSHVLDQRGQAFWIGTRSGVRGKLLSGSRYIRSGSSEFVLL